MELQWKLMVLVVLCKLSGEQTTHKTLDRAHSYNEIYNVYKGCGFIKYCIKICLQIHGSEDKCTTCIKNKNCPAIVTMRHERGVFYTQLFIQQVSDQSDYISIGLSKDGRMLNSPYVACVHRTDQLEQYRIVMYSGYTAADYTTVFYFPMDDKSQIFYNKVGKEVFVKDQPRPAFYCEFIWKSTFILANVGESSYNLSSDSYHIIAATGFAGDYLFADWAISAHTHTENGRVFTVHPNIMTKVPISEKDYDEDYDCEAATCDHLGSATVIVSTVLPFVMILSKNFLFLKY